MTVCTNDVALGDLVDYGGPVAVAQAFGDVEPLGSDVVELEHERIGLAAVDARLLAKEGHEVCGPLGYERALAAEGIRHVALAVRCVVLAFVSRPAYSAVVVALPASLPAPGEVGGRLALPAAAAGSCWLEVARHEHMFP